VRINDVRLTAGELLSESERIQWSVRQQILHKRRMWYALSIASSVTLLLMIAGFSYFSRVSQKLVVKNDHPEEKEIRLTLRASVSDLQRKYRDCP
jgi:hypothetical protein